MKGVDNIFLFEPVVIGWKKNMTVRQYDCTVHTVQLPSRRDASRILLLSIHHKLII